MSEAAITTADAVYPAYVNFKRVEDGGFVVTVRGAPRAVKGTHVCGFERDRGAPGRCVPGDETCNNYCNMAPQNGPMAAHPKPWEGVREGQTIAVQLTCAEFEALRSAMADIGPT